MDSPTTTLMFNHPEDLRLAAIELEEKGYSKIPSVFHPHEMELIRNESYQCLNFIKSGDPRLQKKGDRPALLFWPMDMSFVLKAYSKHEKMVEIVQSFLGNDIRQLNNQVYFRESGDQDEFAWHQDICFRTPESSFDQIESGYLQTIIVVDEIRENGAIEFIPGSHKWGNLNLIPRDGSEKNLRKFVRGSWSGEKVVASPGDVLLWSVMVVHGSEKNESGRNRMTYMSGFAKGSSVKTEEYPWYLKNGRLV